MQAPQPVPPARSETKASGPEAVRRAAFQALARGDAERGIAAYREVLAEVPNDLDAHAQLAHAYERNHDLAAARAHAEAALAAAARANIARVVLARVQLREGDYAGAEATVLPQARSEQSSLNDRAVAWGLVGDARDLAGDAPGAFAAFTEANSLALTQHRALRDAGAQLFHPEGVRAMSAFVAQTDVAAWRPRGAFTTPAPVFLVGFPRSGTTLLDQVLSSHPAMTCLEEKDYFGRAVCEVFKRPEQLAGMGAISDADVATVRRAYWRNVGSTAATVVVDKLPLNVVVLPLIKAVFPDAKILVALRDPRDVVLSCFQQRFGMNVAMAQMLELDTAAAYYDAVMGLLELSRERLDLDVHAIRYEDVVGDLEGQARAVTDFLGLPFDAAMLDYRSTALSRDINTPSARQVIQPLYTRSIGRWRRYAEQLAPVLPVLNGWAERYGYALA